MSRALVVAMILTGCVSSARRPHVAGAVGTALLATAAGLTIHARGDWMDATERYDPDGVTSAQHQADVATAFSIAGAIAIGAGIVWWVRDHHDTE